MESKQEGPKSLRSFYGASDRLKNVNTTKALIGSPDTFRPQEIYTPKHYLDAIREVWPEGIALDPCSGPDSLVGARKALYTPPTVIEGSTGKKRIIYTVQDPTQDGLSVPWEPFTYFNPPYAFKKDWLNKCMMEYVEGVREVICLVQVATQRSWFRAACVIADDICWMDPLTFVGYPSSFPAPLCTLYYGDRKEQFRKVFADFGDCACWS